MSVLPPDHPEDAPWWWLSFVDTSQPYVPEQDYPGGPRWAGAAIVQGWTLGDAVSTAWAKGCNPGGAVSAVPLPGPPPDLRYVNRLLGHDDIAAMESMEPGGSS